MLLVVLVSTTQQELGQFTLESLPQREFDFMIDPDEVSYLALYPGYGTQSRFKSLTI